MQVPFENLPDDARVWIYQSNRPFTATELEEISLLTASFLEKWTAHGSDLHAGVTFPYNRFVVIGLDQGIAGATGCSIDSSVRFIQSLESAYNVDLLDKMNVTYKNGEYLAHKELNDFKKMAKDKSVTAKTIVFNNLVATIGEFREFWEVPASESWHARFF